jgi:hypothetical protein
MLKLLIPPLTKVRSSEKLKIIVWTLLVSRWHKDDLDGLQLLISPLATDWSSERREYILLYLLVGISPV